MRRARSARVMVRSPERRKKIPQPWTHAEHAAFLTGLSAFGKGRWKDISTHYVPSRTSTQVASHAQKYYARKDSNLTKRQRRYSSMFDTTARVEGSDESPCATQRDASEPHAREGDERGVDNNAALPALDHMHPQFFYISPILLYNYFLMTHSMSHLYTIPKTRYPLYSEH